MTIICPRCAARFSVANTTGITCPACGAKLALRDDPSRRSSTPAPPQRRAPAPQPIIDLPVPKRALSAALDPQSGASRGGSAGSLGGKASAARPKERWRIRSEHLAELPEPVGEQPRNPRRAAALRTSTGGKPSPAPAAVVPKAVAPMPSPPAPSAPPAPVVQSVPAAAKVPAVSLPAPAAVAIAAPIERAMPRIPVTKPEIPAGVPTRPLSDEATDKRGSEPAANPAAAATRQELAPVPATAPAAPALARRDGPSQAPVPEPLAPSESSGGVSVRNVAVKMPAAEVARVAAGGAETAVPSPAVVPAVPGAPVPVVSVPPIAAVPAVVLPAPERPTAADGRAAGGEAATASAVPKVAASVVAPPVIPPVSATASPVPAAAKSEPSPVAGEAANDASAQAAGSGESNQAATSAETQLLDESETPPAVQLGWVIAVLLGLAVMLVTWIVYRASVGH